MRAHGAKARLCTLAHPAADPVARPVSLSFVARCPVHCI